MSGCRKWLFRLAAMTLVPALILGILELTLRVGGYGYPTRFFVQRPDITGPNVYIANAEFGRRFFPPGLTRAPLPLRLAIEKPAGTKRIFILGESAALGFPDPSSSFARILDVMLREAAPDQRYEVINTSMVAINSNTILPIARECAGYQPDVFIVFMGNNEVVGPFGAAGVVGPFTPSLGMIRANLALKTTRTGQLLERGAQWLSSNRKSPQAWEGMAIFQHSRIRASDPQLVPIYDHLRQNLRDIIQVGNAAGAKVIVGTVPVNLKDSAPFASLHAPDLSDEDLPKWAEIYKKGAALEAEKQWSEAIAHYEEAERIDSQYADLYFRWGRCLIGLDKNSEARKRFEQARDLDTLRFRSDANTNAAIRIVAEAESVTLVDAEAVFAAASSGGIPGDDFFLEHVHFNFAGAHLLAQSFCEKVLDRKVKLLSEQECAKRLAHTDWSRHDVAVHIQRLMAQPPFTSQLDRSERDARWQKKIDALRERLKADGLKKAAADFEQAMHDRDDDWMLAMNYAALLAEMGDLTRGMILYEKVARREPQVFPARTQLGQLALRTGKTDEAQAHFRAVLKFAPDYSEAHYGLADALAQDGLFDSAQEIFIERIKRDPTPALALEKMAAFLVRHKKLDEAQARLEEALALDPNSASVRANLGDVLLEQGKTEAARPHWEAALRLRPGWPAMIERLEKTAPK